MKASPRTGRAKWILLAKVTHAMIYHSDLSHNSGWGIAGHSSWNDLLENHAIGTCAASPRHIRTAAISAGVLLMDASNRNRIVGKQLHAQRRRIFPEPRRERPGERLQLRCVERWQLFAAQRVESTVSEGDEFRSQYRAHDYGFWLGFSHDTTIADNHIEGSKRDGNCYRARSGTTSLRNRSSERHIGNSAFPQRYRPSYPSERYHLLEKQFHRQSSGV